MEFTRRASAVAATAVALLGLAVVFDRPLLLAAGATTGAWLLARQYTFARQLERTDAGLAVEQTVSRDRVATEGTVTATLEVATDRPPAVSLALTASPPVGVEADGGPGARRTTIDVGNATGSTTFGLRGTVAGRHEFGPVTVDARDSAGLFRETYEREAGCSIRVVPRTPGEIHVGEGGERFAIAYGEHDTGRRGSGHDPAEVREYTAGDAAKRIDWKATARLAKPHVREFETETDRTMAILVDHRAVTGDGRAGETKLDYLRQVALGLLDNARDHDDPVGCYTVGDEGLTSSRAPGATDDAYAEIEGRLDGLEPTGSPTDGREPGARGGSATLSASQPMAAAGLTPAEARRAAATLGDDGSSFGRTLAPFFEASDPYVERVSGEPLFGAVRSTLGRIQGEAVVAILTDDANPTEVREAVRAARAGERRVLVFLTPTVLFEPGGLSDIEAAYDRYVTFESFRRDLASLDLVNAYEVAPGDRLDAVLAAGRRRRTGGRGRRPGRRSEPEVEG